MVSKMDCERVIGDLIREERERLGDVPTPEELIALARGTLPPAEADRIRQLIAYYPDLAAALMEEEPAHLPRIGDPDYLSDTEHAAAWAQLQRRVGTTVVPFGRRMRRAIMAAASVILAMLGGWFGHAIWSGSRTQVNVQHFEIEQDGHRGKGDDLMRLAVDHQAEHLALTLHLADERSFGEYRISVVDLSTARIVYRGGGLRRAADGTLGIQIPRKRLVDRTSYRLDLFGDARREPVATYTFAVPAMR